MKKRACIITSILVVIILALCASIYFTTGAKCDTPEKNEIKATVEKALRIRYGWLSKDKVKDIATPKGQKNMKNNSFYEGFHFYTIGDRHFMDSSYYEEGTGDIIVSVPVYNPDIIIPIFTLSKGQNGKYLITDFGCDI